MKILLYLPPHDIYLVYMACGYVDDLCYAYFEISTDVVVGFYYG